MYAIKCYTNPQSTGTDDFKRDMKCFAYISKVLQKIVSKPEINQQHVRQLLNHIISLCNVFGNKAVARMLFFYYPSKYHPILKTSMDHLFRLPDTKMSIEPEIRGFDPVPWDQRLLTVLEKNTHTGERHASK